jgi:hypothetical protein
MIVAHYVVCEAYVWAHRRTEGREGAEGEEHVALLITLSLALHPTPSSLYFSALLNYSVSFTEYLFGVLGKDNGARRPGSPRTSWR